MLSSTLLLSLNLYNEQTRAANQAKLGETTKAVNQKTATSGIEEDKTPIKNSHGQSSTVGQAAQEQDKHNLLGKASMFHIFAKETKIASDCNGNIATKEYKQGNEFGTRQDSHNVTGRHDVNYFGQIDQMGAQAFRKGDPTETREAILGKNTKNVTKTNGQVQIKNQDGSITTINNGLIKADNVKRVKY